MNLQSIENQIEALIYSSEKGINIDEIKSIISEITDIYLSDEDICRHLSLIKQKYREANASIDLVLVNNGYQFLTKKEFHPVIRQLHLQRSKKALSQAALETLAIIAYKQPVTKLEVEQIRGVNCDYSIQKLLDKELIIISGRASSVGKPLIYSVSALFLDYFGINSPSELPKLKEMEIDNFEKGDKTE